MKEKLRKTAIIISVIAFAVFSTLAYPMEKIEAAPVAAAVPVGITVGAGTYAVGALALAGVVGLAGYDTYSEQINAHAAGVWQGGTQAAKDSLNVSIDLARGAGTGMVNLRGDFINFMDGKLSGLSKSTATTITSSLSSDGVGISKSASNITASPSVAGGAIAGSMGVHSSVNVYKSSTMFHVGLSAGSTTFGYSSVAYASFVKKSENPALFLQLESMFANANTLSDMQSMASIIGYSFSPVLAEEWISNNGIVETQMNEAWTSMRDAGLVLPVDGATAYSGDKVVTHNPSADTYTDDAGTTYAPGDVTWAFPQPRIRTDGVPVPGVYTDTPALTGNPAIDEPIIANPDIPKTTTNVYTGTTIANPDIATGNPAVPIDPAVPGTVIPPFDTPGTTGLDFTPLMMNGSAMTNKFPFSIPFDFVRQLQVLNVEPEAPSFNINIPEFLKIGTFVVPFKMDLSFEMFDPIANIIRWGMIVIFDISLIFAIRKLLPE